MEDEDEYYGGIGSEVSAGQGCFLSVSYPGSSGRRPGSIRYLGSRTLDTAQSRLQGSLCVPRLSEVRSGRGQDSSHSTGTTDNRTLLSPTKRDMLELRISGGYQK